MKCLAIADLFIDKKMMDDGLALLKEKGIEVEVKEWQHADLEALQKDNITLEKQGSESVDLPDYLMEGIEAYDYLITQFAPVGKKSLIRQKN